MCPSTAECMCGRPESTQKASFARVGNSMQSVLSVRFFSRSRTASAAPAGTRVWAGAAQKVRRQTRHAVKRTLCIELQKAASVRRASTWTDGHLSMGADALSASAASRKQACSSAILLDSFRAAIWSAHLSVVSWPWPLHPTIVLHLLRVAVCQVGFGRRE